MLWDALVAPANGDSRLTVVNSAGAQQLSWGELARLGERAANGLRHRGVTSGDRVGLVLTNSIDAIASLAGVWFTGATAVSLPPIARGMSVDAHLAQVARLCEHAHVEHLLVNAQFRELFDGVDRGLAVASYDVVVDTAGSVDPAPPERDEVAFAQFSSGVTGEPRGAALTGSAITAQLTALAEAVAVDPNTDRVTAWLPLSHDMGLFGCLLLSWFTGMPLLLGTPERFVTSPRTWLDDCAGSGATLTAIQPSALRLAARTASAGCDELSLRACLVGGERIPPGLLDEAARMLSERGTSPAALTPAYGLAEATLAVAVAPVDEPPCMRLVDGDALWAGRVIENPEPERIARVVSCGPPLRGTSVVVDGSAAVGELRVRSPSLARGYLDGGAATDAKFVNGVLATGDIGFVRDGEVYPLARTDDVLNVAGRRVDVLVVEEALSRHNALRPGRCAVVDVVDDDRVRHVAVAELAEGHPDLPVVARDLRRTALSAGGVPLDECVFVERGLFPKTASGKVQRFRARTLASRGDAGARVVLRGG